MTEEVVTPALRGRFVCTKDGSTQRVLKNYAGDPFMVGDVFHCPFCGQKITVSVVEAEGHILMPAHKYPTKKQKAAMRRGRQS